MATNRIALFQLGILCFILPMLMPAAHGKKGTGVVMLYGTARCKSNPSRTINNGTLLVKINGTMVATGKTSSSGRFLLVVNVTSRNQLMALARKEAAITTPPQACGGGGSVPAIAAASGRKLAVTVGLTGSVDDDDTETTDDQLMIILGGDSNDDDRLVDDILNSPPSQSEIDQAALLLKDSGFISIVLNIDQSPETIDNLNFIEDYGLPIYDYLDTICNFLVIPPIGSDF